MIGWRLREEKLPLCATPYSSKNPGLNPVLPLSAFSCGIHYPGDLLDVSLVQEQNHAGDDKPSHSCHRAVVPQIKAPNGGSSTPSRQ